MDCIRIGRYAVLFGCSLGWPDAVEFAESAAEIELVFVADFHGDLFYQHIAMSAEFQSGLHSSPDNIGVDRFAAPFAMQSVEVVGGHSG